MAQRVEARLTFKASEAFSLFVSFRRNLHQLKGRDYFSARGVRNVAAYIMDDPLEAWAGFRRVDVFVELECDSWGEAEKVARELLEKAAELSRVTLTEDGDYLVNLSQSELAENSSMFTGA